jgi:hypothetical protein
MAMTAIVPRATGTAGAAFESRATWTATVWATITTTVGTSATAVWTATAAAIASTTLWALETGAGIAADAGGITREIFARSGSTANAWSARFTGEQDDIVFDDRRSRRGLACVSFD